MRLVCLSDTHGLHRQVCLPPGDVLVHAGDFTDAGGLEEIQDFMTWFSTVGDYRHRVVVAGNHDRAFEHSPAQARALVPGNVTYLENGGATLSGLTFWGSPWTPTFGDMAFNGTPPRLQAIWSRIPAGVDVLVTHGPPYGLLDALDGSGRAVGCPDLRNAVRLAAPRLHVFGHIHHSAGQIHWRRTLFANTCICDERYRPVLAPTVLRLRPRPGQGRGAP